LIEPSGCNVNSQVIDGGEGDRNSGQKTKLQGGFHRFCGRVQVRRMLELQDAVVIDSSVSSVDEFKASGQDSQKLQNLFKIGDGQSLEAEVEHLRQIQPLPV
jgi:hypothetical protein